MGEVGRVRSARQSPPTERVADVLDYLVARPDRRFGLSELAREVGISKPTCLGIVTVLADRGYLARDGVTKTYGLGPTLIAAGRAAGRGFGVGPLVRPHLERISTRFETTCTASGLVGEQIRILEVVAPAGVRGGAKVGQVYPFAPPIGLMYVLWGSDRDLERWLSREPSLPIRLDRDRLWDVVRQCRAVGYLVESLDPMGQRLHSVMAGVATHNLPSEVRDLLGEMVSSVGERVYLDRDIGSDDKHPVNVIAAPTYDEDGRQSLVLTLYVGDAVSGAEIAECGAALVAAAHAVTQVLGGRAPGRDNSAALNFLPIGRTPAVRTPKIVEVLGP